jgi:hypothetical protein
MSTPAESSSLGGGQFTAEGSRHHASHGAGDTVGQAVRRLALPVSDQRPKLSKSADGGKKRPAATAAPADAATEMQTATYPPEGDTVMKSEESAFAPAASTNTLPCWY